MNAPPALVGRAPYPTAPAAEGDLGLTALLALFAPDDAASTAPAARGALRSDAARLRAWVRDGVRRAAAWGSGPGVPGVPGDRTVVRPSSLRPAPAEVK